MVSFIYQHNNKLNPPMFTNFTKDDVLEAVQGMAPTKAVGFQHFWHVIGKDASSFCLSILNDDASLGDINDTNVVLNPNIRSLQAMMNFRPISLCNVLFKIILKAIVNRYAKKNMPFCMDEAQSAFVPSK